MTEQEKFVKGSKTILYACRPLVFYILTTGFFMTLGMFIRGMQGNSGMFLKESRNFYSFSGVLIYWWIMFRRARRQKRSLLREATLELRPLPDLPELAGGFLLGASASLFFSALLTLLPLPAFLRDAYHSSAMQAFAEPDRLLVILMLTVLLPFTEEMIFRGLMLNRLLTFFRLRTALFLSAALFALCHVDPVWMIYAFFMGLLIGILSIRKDNIRIAVLIHMGFNFPSVIETAIPANASLKSTPAGIFLIVIIGFCALAAFFLLLQRIYKNKGEV